MRNVLWLWLGLVTTRRHLTALDLLSRARRERDELANRCAWLVGENGHLREQLLRARAAQLRDVLRGHLREGPKC